MDAGIRIIICEIWAAVLCVVIAFIQKRLIKKNIRYSHWIWGTIFFVAFALPSWFLTKNPVVLIAGILIRECLFSPFLNLIRKLPFFYTNTDDPDGSDLDKLEKGVSKPLYFLSCLGLIVLQFIFFKDGIQ